MARGLRTMEPPVMWVKHQASERSGDLPRSFFISALVMTFILPFDVGFQVISEISPMNGLSFGMQTSRWKNHARARSHISSRNRRYRSFEEWDSDTFTQ